VNRPGSYGVSEEDVPEGDRRQGGSVCVALVEDHLMFSASLAAALRAEGHQVVVPVLSTLDAVVDELAAAAPRVALLDLDLGPFGSGEDLLVPLTRGAASVVMLSGTSDEAAVGRCLIAGAVGWVPKHEALERVLGVVDDALAGRPVAPAAEVDRLKRVWRQRQEAVAAALAPFERLTTREAAVLAGLVDGHAVEQIAAESFVSVATVRSQVRAVLAKLGVGSQLEAVAAARRTGWPQQSSDHVRRS